MAENLQNTSKVDINIISKPALVTDINSSFVSKEQYSFARNAIRNSNLFICFVSTEYCNSGACDEEFSLAKKLKKKMIPIMLTQEATNGFELTIVKLKRLDAFKPPNVFDPWSEDLYLKLLDRILDLTQGIDASVAKSLSNLVME